jgi:hypothetical protein
MRTMPARALASLLRIAFAAIFGFVSLAHGPVMAFAETGAAPANHHQIPAGHHRMMMAGHEHHAADRPQHAADQQDDQLPSIAPKPAICYSFGCFNAVQAAAVAVPAAVLSPLAKLSPSSAPAELSFDRDPVDPPPRLRA